MSAAPWIRLRGWLRRSLRWIGANPLYVAGLVGFSLGLGMVAGAGGLGSGSGPVYAGVAVAATVISLVTGSLQYLFTRGHSSSWRAKLRTVGAIVVITAVVAVSIRTTGIVRSQIVPMSGHLNVAIVDLGSNGDLSEEDRRSAERAWDSSAATLERSETELEDEFREVHGIDLIVEVRRVRDQYDFENASFDAHEQSDRLFDEYRADIVVHGVVVGRDAAGAEIVPVVYLRDDYLPDAAELGGGHVLRPVELEAGRSLGENTRLSGDLVDRGLASVRPLFGLELMRVGQLERAVQRFETLQADVALTTLFRATALGLLGNLEEAESAYDDLVMSASSLTQGGRCSVEARRRSRSP